MQINNKIKNSLAVCSDSVKLVAKASVVTSIVKNV
jgi:hypothetical protein